MASEGQAKVETLFAQWDLNKDGVIDEEEMVRVLTTIGLKEAQAKAGFEQADANKDGKVCLLEFLEWVFAAMPNYCKDDVMSERSRKALQSAMDAVKNLMKKDLLQLKAPNQPKPCQDVLEAVAIVSSTPKELINDPKKYIDMLVKFDPNSITADALPKIKPLTSKKTFCADVLKKESIGAKHLCQWVLGMQCYLVDQKILQQMKLSGDQKILQQMQCHLALKKGSLSGEAYQRLAAAMSAIDGLKPEDLIELAYFKVPPERCVDVLAAVGYLVTDTKKRMDWSDAQKLMNDLPSFIQTLQLLDPDSITADTLQNLKTITSQEHFTFDYMLKASTAAAALCQWVLAMQEYAEAS